MKAKYRRGLAIGPGVTSATYPTLTSGAGAPSAAEPDGSVYLRTDGASGTTIYGRVSSAWLPHPITKSYNSGQRTGTGSQETIAHSLGRSPSWVVVVPEAGHDGAGAAGTQCPTITQGTHTTTNVLVTVSAGAKYRIVAEG